MPMAEDPSEAPLNAELIGQPEPPPLSPEAEYNIVTDTVTGLNLRMSDNKFQAIVVVLSMVMASVLGAIAAALNVSWELPWYGGALIGSFAGLVFGTLGSGMFLMFYRGVRHMQGKHD